MIKKGWMVRGQGAELQIVEHRASEQDYDFDKLCSYEEAKAQALQRLQEHAQPYLDRIADISSDTFKASRALPHFRAWYHSKRVVVAKTKKRAMELAHISRYEFENYWEECGGYWWYQLAQAEGLWVEDKDTSEFVRSMMKEEADGILASYETKCMSMDIQQLLSLAGSKIVESGESSVGTPYTVTVRIYKPDWIPGQVHVNINVDDGLGWHGRFCTFLRRDIPQPEVVDWIQEGF